MLGYVRRVDLIISQDGKVFSYTLRPLSDAKWARVREKVEQAAPKVPVESTVKSETTSIADATQTVNADNGVIVDAARELRVKLYMGQVCRCIFHSLRDR